MKILFDLVTTQLFIGGSQEYIRKIFYTILEKIKVNDELWIAHDSSIGEYAYSDLTPSALSGKVAGAVDLAGKSLPEIINQNGFDKLFIGCAQRWGERYDVAGVRCCVVCVMHDICDEESLYEHLNYYVKLGDIKGFIKRIGRRLVGIDRKALLRTKPICEMMKRNPRASIITVSEFSRYSISFHLHIPLEQIKVLWSPERVGVSHDEIENPLLREIIDSGQKYILMTNANRELKNARKIITAFKRYSQDVSDCILVTVGYPKEEYPSHRVLPYLSESDLLNAQRNCYAFVFPSYFEGFGYPPVEVMRWAKPVLTSNVTSMPEVLGDAPIYFSPYYTSDIYAAFHKLRTSDYNDLCERSFKRYSEISLRQRQDLLTLVSELLS